MNSINKKGASTYITVIITAIITALICYIVFRVISISDIMSGKVAVNQLDSGYGETYAATISGDFTSEEKRALARLLLQNKMNRLKNIIDSDYLYDYDINDMMDYVALGMLVSIDDPYAQYYNKEDFEQFYTETEGEYCGIGIYVSFDKIKNMPMVLFPLEDSPALSAGIKPGDYIEYVDDVFSINNSYDDTIDAIKGVEGTKVKIGLIRISKDDKEEKIEVEVERKKIQLNPIKSNVYDNIGYIRLSSFDDVSFKYFKEKYEELINKSKVKGLIIDLRDNPGGVLTVCTDITDLILPEGKIVYTVNKAGIEKAIYSDSNSIKIPLVVLINENSASASEVFASAIKDYGVGTIIGKKSYGKGVVQTLKSLKDGTYVKFTTEEYYSPKGNKINKIGVEPDIEVDLPTNVKSTYDLKYEDDTQLQRAIDEIKKKI